MGHGSLPQVSLQSPEIQASVRSFNRNLTPITPITDPNYHRNLTPIT